MEKTRHYLILDGLRGVAALIVLAFHLCEVISYGHGTGTAGQSFYHGFLAVDFFLLLSGFVMGYAYDQKWDRMSIGSFIKRRLIRLHPMVVAGAIAGTIMFACQGFVNFYGEVVPIWKYILCAVLALFLIPAPGCVEAKGLGEIFPFNGPHWSLFYEYIGSILYALALRKLKNIYLIIIIVVSAITLLVMGLVCPDHYTGFGWAGDYINVLGGSCRLMFAYTAGLLMSRYFREKAPRQIKFPLFPVCSIVLLALMAVPTLGEKRAIYEMAVITLAFPAIVWFGARGSEGGEKSKKVMEFLGKFSYPLYAVHYPFMGLYLRWIQIGKEPFGTVGTPIVMLLCSLTLAYLLMRFYDAPLRKKLSERFLK